MILLDTHIWRWWVEGSARISIAQREAIASAGRNSLGVSAFSCWEIAKAVASGTLALSFDVDKWIQDALRFPNIVLVPLSPQIAVESTRLPPPIHRDPGDQIIIATAKVLGIPLLTADAKILAYPHVQKIG